MTSLLPFIGIVVLIGNAIFFGLEYYLTREAEDGLFWIIFIMHLIMNGIYLLSIW